MRYLSFLDRLANPVEGAEQIGDQPVGSGLGDLGLRALLLQRPFGEQSLEPAGGLGLGGEDGGVIGGKTKLLPIPAAMGVGPFGKAVAAFVVAFGGPRQGQKNRGG